MYNLLHISGNWNWDAISVVLLDHVIQSIKALPISLSNSLDDNIVWKSALDGIFSLKSAYSLSLRLSSTSFDPPKTSMNWIWRANCHARRKIFLWKIMVNALPSKNALFYRGIGPDATCCGIYLPYF